MPQEGGKEGESGRSVERKGKERREGEEGGKEMALTHLEPLRRRMSSSTAVTLVSQETACLCFKFLLSATVELDRAFVPSLASPFSFPLSLLARTSD